MMTRTEARAFLIDRLTDNFIEVMMGDHRRRRLYEVAREGHQGFEERGDFGLLKAAEDAGLFESSAVAVEAAIHLYPYRYADPLDPSEDELGVDTRLELWALDGNVEAARKLAIRECALGCTTNLDEAGDEVVEAYEEARASERELRGYE